MYEESELSPPKRLGSRLCVTWLAINFFLSIGANLGKDIRKGGKCIHPLIIIIEDLRASYPG